MCRTKYHFVIRFLLIWRQLIHSCYLWCIHSHTAVLFRKISDGCLQDDKRPVRRAGYYFTKQVHELVLIFTISTMWSRHHLHTWSFCISVYSLLTPLVNCSLQWMYLLCVSCTVCLCFSMESLAVTTSGQRLFGWKDEIFQRTFL